MATRKLRVTGGPHGKNMNLELDGFPVPNAYRLDLQTSVDDAVRIQVGYVVVEMENLEVEGIVEHVVHLKTRSLSTKLNEGGDPIIVMDAIEQKGSSLTDCLRRLADRLEQEALPIH